MYYEDCVWAISKFTLAVAISGMCCKLFWMGHHLFINSFYRHINSFLHPCLQSKLTSENMEWDWVLAVLLLFATFEFWLSLTLLCWSTYPLGERDRSFKCRYFKEKPCRIILRWSRERLVEMEVLENKCWKFPELWKCSCLANEEELCQWKIFKDYRKEMSAKQNKWLLQYCK